MGNVLAPVNKRGRVFVRIGLSIVVRVNHHVASIDFESRRDQDDDILPNGLNERTLFHGQAVRQLHQHLRRAGFGRVNRSGCPVQNFPFADQLFGLSLVDFARVGQLGGDLFVSIELRNRRFISDRDEQLFPSLLTLFGRGENLDAGSSLLEFAIVAIQILGVSQVSRLADRIAENLVRRWHFVRRRQVIDKLSHEVRLGRVLFDLRGVSCVDGTSRSARLRFGLR